MNKEQKMVLKEWLSTRPPEVQKLAKEFPPGMALIIHGQVSTVIGYTEDDELIITHEDPSEDYDKALAHKQYVCAKHFR